jgi:C4-dicarboxylate-specific signal transduction histidine kinase
LAHELNQPLAAVVCYVSALENLLASPNFDAAQVAAVGGSVVAQAHRAAEIIRRWRGLIRRTPPQRALVNVNTLVNEVLVLVHNDLHLANCALNLNLAVNLAGVDADSIQIQQVLLNLARNAIDALCDVPESRRSLTVQTSLADGNSVRISVSDTGPGVKPEIAAHLFESFVSSKPSGLGVGLAISRSIIEAHDGKIWAEPNSESGVTFHFTLPLAKGDVP